MLSKRWKVDKEFRAFKEQWENNFVLVNHLGRPADLIFTEHIALNKQRFLIFFRVCFFMFLASMALINFQINTLLK